MIESMTQVEFNQLYDKLSRYATSKARQYFSDDSLCYDVIDEAMDRFIDGILITPEINDVEAWGRAVIANSLKNSARNRELESITVVGEEYEGMHGYQIK